MIATTYTYTYTFDFAFEISTYQMLVALGVLIIVIACAIVWLARRREAWRRELQQAMRRGDAAAMASLMRDPRRP